MTGYKWKKPQARVEREKFQRKQRGKEDKLEKRAHKMQNDEAQLKFKQ